MRKDDSQRLQAQGSVASDRYRLVKKNLEVLANDIHPMDQIELHKKTSDMVYATLTHKATLAHELKESLKNTNTQLDLEKFSSSTKTIE